MAAVAAHLLKKNGGGGDQDWAVNSTDNHSGCSGQNPAVSTAGITNNGSSQNGGPFQNACSGGGQNRATGNLHHHRSSQNCGGGNQHRNSSNSSHNRDNGSGPNHRSSQNNGGGNQHRNSSISSENRGNGSGQNNRPPQNNGGRTSHSAPDRTEISSNDRPNRSNIRLRPNGISYIVYPFLQFCNTYFVLQKVEKITPGDL